MSFRKPFRAEPVKLGPYWRAEKRREQRRQALRGIGTLALITCGIFVMGMVVTNWNALRATLPTYYPSCSWARSAGAAPLARGSPGYRLKLDADNDGVACEPYRGG